MKQSQKLRQGKKMAVRSIGGVMCRNDSWQAGDWYHIPWNAGIISRGILVPYSMDSWHLRPLFWYLILWNAGILYRGEVVSYAVEYPDQ